MRSALLMLCAMVQIAFGSKAWSDFVTHSSKQVHATSLTAMRRAGAAANKPCWAIVQGTDKAPSPRYVQANKFIANSTTSIGKPECSARVSTLCAKAAAGTTIPLKKALTAADVTGMKKQVPPQCFYCLTKGYGTSEKTPGYYLPCGCQNTCVDVSGNLYTMKNGIKKALDSCQAYIDAKLVSKCNDIAIYHCVLWPTLLAALTVVYMAYFMVNMDLDMNSLLTYISIEKAKKE